MIEFLAPVLASAVAGVFASLLSTFLRSYVYDRRKNRESLRYEIGGRSIKVPIASDLQSLEHRVRSLEAVSPTLAVLDGWQMISAAVIDRASATLGEKYKPAEDVLQIARAFPDITPAFLSKMERLKHLRNSVAHSASNIDDKSLRESVHDIVPILTALGMQYKPNPVEA